MAIVPVSHKTVLISVLLFPVPVVSVAADTGNGLIGKTVAVVKDTKRLENIQNLAETAGDDTWGENFPGVRLASSNVGRSAMKRGTIPESMALLICICCFLAAPVLAAEGKAELSKGQLIYVPAYSHIYSGNKETPFLLAVTLSIRNVDPRNRITITMVDYYETQGKLLKKYLEQPVTLNALESLRYVVAERDTSGGSGANFLVRWEADGHVNPPIVESIMIGTQFQQGISFTSRGREIIAPEGE